LITRATGKFRLIKRLTQKYKNQFNYSAGANTFSYCGLFCKTPKELKHYKQSVDDVMPASLSRCLHASLISHHLVPWIWYKFPLLVPMRGDTHRGIGTNQGGGLPSSFNHIEVASGQDPGRTEKGTLRERG